MKTTQIGLNLIKEFEGFSANAYVDAAGFLTIGYGHLIRSNEQFDEAIDIDFATQLLAQDVVIAERAVKRFITAPLYPNQFDALVSFTFNLGAGALQRSTLRQKINRAEHDAVPNELLRWVWAGGQKLNGLIRRRKAEGYLYAASD